MGAPGNLSCLEDGHDAHKTGASDREHGHAGGAAEEGPWWVPLRQRTSLQPACRSAASSRAAMR